MNNICVCCGETIPEGRQVCKSCEEKSPTQIRYLLYDANDGCRLIGEYETLDEAVSEARKREKKEAETESIIFKKTGSEMRLIIDWWGK